MEGEKAGTKTYQYQSIAFSLDKGRTFTKYQGNPVVRNPGIKDFRDPKVIWDQENKQWVMVFAAYDKVLFYTSSNLRDWTKSGEFGIEGDTRLWECPDMFPLKVEGSDEIKWVLITSILKEAPNGGTATAYFVGDWDGNAFIGDPDNLKWLDYGTDNYAFVTWSDIPESDGRRLGIGWMSNWQYAQSVPTEKWRSAMTLPRELNLHKVDDYYIVFSQPVRELKTLNEKIENIDSGTIENDVVLTNNESSGLFKINLTFENPGENAINLKFSNDKNEFLIVGYDGESKSYFIDRTQSGKTNFSDVFSVKHIFDTNYEKETIEMTIYLDHASIELFADQGRCVMTDIFFSSSPFNNVEILGSENPVQLISGQLTSLKSIWR
jgi:fructan beta-fructosidase